MTKKYISDGSWFDQGTEAELIMECTEPTDTHRFGLFKGIRLGRRIQEVRKFDEFTEVERNTPSESTR